jgi:hypothetical protein
MDGACSTHGGGEKSVQNVGKETSTLRYRKVLDQMSDYHLLKDIDALSWFVNI